MAAWSPRGGGDAVGVWTGTTKRAAIWSGLRERADEGATSLDPGRTRRAGRRSRAEQGGGLPPALAVRFVLINDVPGMAGEASLHVVREHGDERLRYFQPLKSLFEAGVIAGGGSDHMQKVGSLRSINRY